MPSTLGVIKISDEHEKSWVYWSEDCVVQQAGGLIDPGYLDEFHRMSCGWVRYLYLNAVSSLKDEHYSDQITNLSLFFIDSHEKNALALERQEAKGIGVHLGLIRSLWAVFYRGLGTGCLLKEWFVEAAPLDRNISDEEAISDPIWRADDTITWEPDRLRTHHDLFIRRVDFIVYHELAHHVRGHISYLRSEFGLTEIDEALNFTAEQGPKRDAFRNLEYDADHAALDMIILALNKDVKFSTWSKSRGEREFFLQSLAIIILFQVLDEAHSPMRNHYLLSHPAPVHRAMRITNALSFTFAREFSWSDQEREEEHDLAWLAAAEIADLFNMPEGRWHGDTIDDMDHDHFLKEEEKFISFAHMLNALNDEGKT